MNTTTTARQGKHQGSYGGEALRWLHADNPTVHSEAVQTFSRNAALFVDVGALLIKDHSKDAANIFAGYSTAEKAEVLSHLIGLKDQDVKKFVVEALHTYANESGLPTELSKRIGKGAFSSEIEDATEALLKSLVPSHLSEYLTEATFAQCRTLAQRAVQSKSPEFVAEVLKQSLHTPDKTSTTFLVSELLKAVDGSERIAAVVLDIAKEGVGARATNETLSRLCSRLEGEVSELSSQVAGYGSAFQSGRAYYKSDAELQEEHRDMIHSMTRD